ncbi:MAG: AmmeMemoRadiSam system protein B [Piscinibacter sp.]|nr:AmmeMemoRadiSam system protein B [Piscinibacter sp.]
MVLSTVLPRTRPAAVAGFFYPGEAAALRADLRAVLDAAHPAPALVAPKMLLVPHAGYVYSGPIAAQAYAALAPWASAVHRVVLLGPTHRVALRGLAAPTVAAFETPLGPVPLDRAALDALAALPQVVAHDGAHAREHALEVQLPFLQAVLGEFTLVPLAVGEASPGEVAEVLERLWGGADTLVVISSDLSHYLPYRSAQAIDRATVDRIGRFATDLEVDEACGARPLAGALQAARAHGLRPRLLDLRNSGDTAGDRDRVVGYCAMVFEPAAAPEDAEAGVERHIEGDSALGDALLVRARNSIAGALGEPAAAEPDHPALAELGATFVTVHVGDELRGCIGTLAARRRLDEDVRAHAHAAAFADHRFEPVRRDELAALRIEVSLLGPSEPLEAADEAQARAALRPGIDGVTLRWRGRSATLLPQVWAQLPDPGDFLATLKRKAGLARDFWARDLRLERYTVRKFAPRSAA